MHRCRRFCVWCALQTVAFPVEHLTWKALLSVVGYHA